MVSSSGYRFQGALDLEIPWLGADAYTIMGYAMAQAAWTMPWLEGHVVSLQANAGASWSENKKRMPFSLSSNSGVVFNTTGQDTSLHGYPAGLVYGKHYLYAKAAYTAALWEPSIALQTIPISLEKLGVSAFFDWGHAWNEDFRPRTSKFDIGAKVHLDFLLGYRMPVRTTLGYAWGGAAHGGHEVFFYWSY